MAGPIRNLDELHADIPGPAYLERPDWQQHGECRGMNPDLWHPGRGEDTRGAKSICERCEVRVECLAFALYTFEEVGIWGGRSERERREMRREMHRRGILANHLVDRRRSSSMAV